MNNSDNYHITRDEFKSEIGRVEGVLGTQIGAVEKTLTAKLGNLRVWGIAALVGGQTTAAVIASYVGPGSAYHSAMHFIHLI